MRWLRRRGRALSVVAFAVVPVVVVALGLTYGPSTEATVLGVVGTLAALVQVWGVVLHRRHGSVDAAVDKLAGSLLDQWHKEAVRRELEGEHRLPIPWDRGPGATADEPPDLGDLPGLLAGYVERPSRLVVLGGPGSGKTGLGIRLVTQLLERPEARVDRLPVLLPASSWDPTVTGLRAWIAERLREEHQFLEAPTEHHRDLAEALVAGRRILPILDGLDEMPEARRDRALAAVLEEMATSEPFVLTCRTDEFLAASGERLLRTAEVVRLLPVDTTSVVAYLRHMPSPAAGARTRERWAPALARLEQEPDGALAAVLSQPVMVFLAWRMYEHPAGDPMDLFDAALDAPDALREHLLDGLVPASYRAGGRAFPRRWTVGKVERWLTFLARHLHDQGTRDLAWWRLHEARPPRHALVYSPLVGAGACAGLGVLLFGLFGRPWYGAALGVAIGAIGGVLLQRLATDTPRRFAPPPWRRNVRWYEVLLPDPTAMLVGVLGGGLVLGLMFGPALALAGGVWFGLTFGMVRRFTEPTEPTDDPSPAGTMRGDRAVVVSAAALGALAGAAAGAVVGGVVGIGADLEAQLVVGADSRAEIAALGAAVGALVGAGAFSLLVAATNAWAALISVRVLLALRGDLPFRVMTLLDVADRQGMLRRSGAYYQFQHALLQDRLIARSTPVPVPAPDDPAPASASAVPAPETVPAEDQPEPV